MRVQQLRRCPKVFQVRRGNLGDTVHYLSVLAGRNTVAYLAIAVSGDVANIHIEVPKWSKLVGVTLIEAWEPVKDWMRFWGCSHVVAANDNIQDELRWGKFIALFGFLKPQHVLYSEQEL